jgi:hypothetical protein
MTASTILDAQNYATFIEHRHSIFHKGKVRTTQRQVDLSDILYGLLFNKRTTRVKLRTRHRQWDLRRGRGEVRVSRSQ